MKNLEIQCLLRQTRESLWYDFRNSIWCIIEIIRVYVFGLPRGGKS